MNKIFKEFLSISFTALLSVLNFCNIHAQQYTLKDTLRIKQYCDEAFKCLRSSPDSMMYYLDKAYVISNQIDSDKYHGAILNTEGVYYAFTGNYKKALKLHSEAYELFVKCNAYKGKASALNNIGIAYKSLGLYSKAIEAYGQSLTDAKIVKDTIGVIGTLKNIGVIYSLSENQPKALEYFKEALNFTNKFSVKNSLKASFYSGIAGVYIKQRKFKQAEENNQKSLDLHILDNDKYGIAHAYSNYARINKEKKEFAKAIDFVQKALAIREQITDTRGIGDSKLLLGELYADMHQNELASRYLKEAISIAEEISYLRIVRDASGKLYQVQKEMGNSSQALKAYEKYILLKDSLSSIDNEKALMRQEYEIDYQKRKFEDSLISVDQKKINDSKLLSEKYKNDKQKLQITLLIIGLIVAIILLAFLYSRYKLARNQKKSVELEKNRNLVLSQRLYEQDQQLILSETAKTVAHQLNSPLGAIKAGMEGLEEQLVNVKLSIIESNPDSTELAFELSKYIDTSSEWNLSQRKKVQQQLYEKIKGHSNLKDENVLKMAKDFSKLSIAEVPENLLTSILSLKESNNALSLAKGISNLNKISKVTQEATVKSSEAVDKIRETLNFKRDISKTEFKLFRTINTVISLLQAKAIDDTQIINKVDKTIILNDNEFRLIQLLYNLLFYIVGEIQKNVQIEINSSNQEEHIVLQILLNKRISSKLFNEHQYSIIFNSKHDSNELRMGIVQFLVVEKNYQILPIALEQTDCVELKLPII